MEFFVNDRLSWKRFLGLSLEEKSPDRNTFWIWQEFVTKIGRYDELFKIFNGQPLITSPKYYGTQIGDTNADLLEDYKI
jgi:IS5 family transposase